VIRLRGTRTDRIVARGRARFRAAGVLVVTVRGHRLPKRIAVDVRFG
jgi:hypothetical protein